jgi:ParB-like chromosome segregation protein Spo0J
MSTIPRLERRVVALADMTPAGYNPRIRLTKGSEKYESLRRSLVEFGETGGIVWNERSGNIVGGHQRYFVLLDEGIEEADVTVMDLDDQHERALNIRLNQPASTWDSQGLEAAYAAINNELRQLTGMADAEVYDLMRTSNVDREGDFLGELADGEVPAMPGVGGAEYKEDHPHRTGEQYFNMQLVLTKEQREIVFRAIDAAKRDFNADTQMEAVVFLCQAYLEAV